MLIQIILFLILGIVFGTFTGLAPGIHTNLLGVFIVSLSGFFIFLNPIYLIVTIVSMAITHTFIDFIPSIFLGCPDTDTELSILPGHKLLKKGLGYEAIYLTCYGGLAAIFILILISFPSVFLVPKIQNNIQKIIPYILIVISFILILTDNKKLKSFSIFLITGILGLCVLNLENIKKPLLPLLTGLFGSSSLIISIKNKSQIPRQKITKPKINSLRPFLGALIASPFCSFLPGLGSGQAAIIGNTLTKNNQKNFLVLLGATNTLVMGFSFISLYAISKTRTGTALAILEISKNITPQLLILILAITLFSGITSFFLTIFLAEKISTKIDKINYTKLSAITIILLLIVVFFISGFFGIIILIISTLTGIYGVESKVRRTNMMGCLIIPTIVLYLF